MSRSSPLLVRAAAPLYWVLLALALVILLRGHNAPGGGFVGGLVAATASGWLALVLGTGAARRRQPLAPQRLAAAGVLLTLASGLPAWTLHLPFLTHLWSGALSTVLLFDFGVFFAVWGTLSGYLYPLLEARPPCT